MRLSNNVNVIMLAESISRLNSPSVIIIRTVKMGWNSLANPAHHRFEPNWVEILL